MTATAIIRCPNSANTIWNRPAIPACGSPRPGARQESLSAKPMESPEQIRDRLVAQFPGAEVTVAANPSQSGQRSLLADAPPVREIARFLRDDESLQLDYCSNVTGVDWPEKEITDTVKVELPDPSGGPPKVVEKKIKRVREGCLEVVYHLYSRPGATDRSSCGCGPETAPTG